MRVMPVTAAAFIVAMLLCGASGFQGPVPLFGRNLVEDRLPVAPVHAPGSECCQFKHAQPVTFQSAQSVTSQPPPAQPAKPILGPWTDKIVNEKKNDGGPGGKERSVPRP